jgi:hypothetical protein
LHPAFFPVSMPQRYTTESDAGSLAAAHDGPLTKTCLNPARLLTPSAVQSLK